VVGVSQKWLLGDLKTVYENLPGDLNAELSFGDEQQWLMNAWMRRLVAWRW